MGPSGHFYSCIGLVTRDTGIPQVDGLSTRHPGIWGVTMIFKTLRFDHMMTTNKHNMNIKLNKSFSHVKPLQYYYQA